MDNQRGNEQKQKCYDYVDDTGANIIVDQVCIDDAVMQLILNKKTFAEIKAEYDSQTSEMIFDTFNEYKFCNGLNTEEIPEQCEQLQKDLQPQKALQSSQDTNDGRQDILEGVIFGSVSVSFMIGNSGILILYVFYKICKCLKNLYNDYQNRNMQNEQEDVEIDQQGVEMQNLEEGDQEEGNMEENLNEERNEEGSHIELQEEAIVLGEEEVSVTDLA